MTPTIRLFKPTLFTIIITIYLSTLLFSTTGSATCTTFTPQSGLLAGSPNDQIFTTTSPRTFRVSAIVNCTGSALGTASTLRPCNATQCGVSIPEYLLLDIDSELNITVSDAQKRQILALVKSSTPQLEGNKLYDFNVSETVTFTGETSACIAENTTQYFGFTPTLICADGVLSGCSSSDNSSDPTNGTAIRACGIELLNIAENGFGVADGTTAFVTTSGVESAPAPANATVIHNSGMKAASAMSMSMYWWVGGLATLGVALWT